MTSAEVRIDDNTAYWTLDVPVDKVHQLTGVPVNYSLRLEGNEVDSSRMDMHGGMLSCSSDVGAVYQLSYTTAAMVRKVGIYHGSDPWSAVEVSLHAPVDTIINTITIDGMPCQCMLRAHGDTQLRINTHCAIGSSRDRWVQVDRVVSKYGENIKMSF